MTEKDVQETTQSEDAEEARSEEAGSPAEQEEGNEEEAQAQPDAGDDADDDDEGDDDEGLLTLTEVSNRTGISMPTLQRYKKEFQDRIPSVGKGRRQRYPEESLPVFEQIKRENIKKRGRPRKSGGAKKKPSVEPARTDLLTLTEVGERTGISYPTLVRYVKMHGDRIPHEGEGRRRRYYPEAVEVFQELRSQSGRGGRRKGSGTRAAAATGGGGGGGKADPGLARRVRSLEKSQDRLETQIRELLRELRKPMTVTIQRK